MTNNKNRSWFFFIKQFFFHDSHTHHSPKCKRRRWLFGRVRRTTTKGLPSPTGEPLITTTPPRVTDLVKKTDIEVTEEKCYVQEGQKSTSKCKIEVTKCTNIVRDDEANIYSFNALVKAHVQHKAATKIQTSYRAHLARKALRALKGFVTLQAIIRGRAVRRQAATTLKCLQSIVSIQSEVCARRSQMSRTKCRDSLLQDIKNQSSKIKQIQSIREKRSDCGLPTKEEEMDALLRKKDAILRAQRIKAYSFNHRKSTDSEEGEDHGRLKHWLKQYVSDQLQTKDSKIGPRRSLQNQRKQPTFTEDSLHPSSPANIPAYMAATKSAKAKTRSVSSPRLRSMHFDGYSDGDSPYKHKLSPISSINSEVTGGSIMSKVSTKSCFTLSQQRSPSLKGVYGPVRSNRFVDDVQS